MVKRDYLDGYAVVESRIPDLGSPALNQESDPKYRTTDTGGQQQSSDGLAQLVSSSRNGQIIDS